MRMLGVHVHMFPGGCDEACITSKGPKKKGSARHVLACSFIHSCPARLASWHTLSLSASPCPTMAHKHHMLSHAW